MYQKKGGVKGPQRNGPAKFAGKSGKVGKKPNGKPQGGKPFKGKPQGGKQAPFKGKQGGPQKKFQKKMLEEMSESDFDDSQLSDSMDEGIAEIIQQKSKKNGKPQPKVSPKKQNEVAMEDDDSFVSDEEEDSLGSEVDDLSEELDSDIDVEPKKMKGKNKGSDSDNSEDDEDMSEDDMDDEEMDDEEMSDFSDEDGIDFENMDSDELESFDEGESEGESDSDEAPQLVETKPTKKETKKEAKSESKKSDKQPEKKTDVKKESKKSSSKDDGESSCTAVIRGVAKSFSVDKLTEFVKSKGVKVVGSATWDKTAGGFTLNLKGSADLEKMNSLRGSKLEKFNLSISTGKPAEKNAEKAKAGEPKEAVKEKKATDSTPTTARLMGLPKSLPVDKLKSYLSEKKVVFTDVAWNKGEGAFDVSLKDKADLDTLKKLKGDKVAQKYRFAVTEVNISADSAGKEKPPKKAKEAVKEESDVEMENDSEEEDSEELEDEDVENESEEVEIVETSPKSSKKKSETKNATIQLRLSGIPKVTPPEKIAQFLKKKGVGNAEVKLQEGQLIAVLPNKSEADRLKAMSGAKFSQYVMNVTDLENAKKQAAETVTKDQQQFRARLLSVPADFAVTKLSNLLKSRGVSSVVVTKENGQYVANCDSKNDFNRLLSMKGVRIDDKFRLMISPLQNKKTDEKQEESSRKRPAEDTEQTPEKKQKVNNADLQSRQLFVGNIPTICTDDMLKKHFNEAIAVKIIRRAGTKKYFGFVTFDSEATTEMVKNAKQKAGGIKIKNELLTLDFCGDKSKKFKELSQAKEAPKSEKEAKVAKKTESEEKKNSQKSRLKTAQSPSKNANVRFADDVIDNEPQDDDDDEDDSDAEEIEFGGSSDDSDFDDDDDDDEDMEMEGDEDDDTE